VLADVFAKPVVTLASQEGSALGAALLAMVGTGEYASVPEVCGAVIREDARVEPKWEDAEVYARGHRVYQALYPALKPVFAQM
jgi:xylulokinase